MKGSKKVRREEALKRRVKEFDRLQKFISIGIYPFEVGGKSVSAEEAKSKVKIAARDIYQTAVALGIQEQYNKYLKV